MFKKIFTLILGFTTLLTAQSPIEKHEWLIMGGKVAHFLISDGRAEKVLNTETDFLDFQANTLEDDVKTNPLISQEVVNKHSLFIDFKSYDFTTFSKLYPNQYKVIMFDWCVLNCALDSTVQNKPCIKQSTLEGCIALLTVGGELFFSDVYNIDKSWLLAQLHEAGLEVEYVDNDHLPDHFKDVKFPECLKLDASGNIIARKKRSSFIDLQEKQRIIEEINEEISYLTEFISAYSKNIDRENEDIKMPQLIEEMRSLGTAETHFNRYYKNHNFINTLNLEIKSIIYLIF
jgi:hypothetical protein